jgi:hypothetical protein
MTATIDAIIHFDPVEQIKFWPVRRYGVVVGRVVDRTPYERHQRQSEGGPSVQLGTDPALGAFEAQMSGIDGGFDGGPEFYTRAEAFAWLKD